MEPDRLTIPSRVVHAYYRGEAVYIIPANCYTNDVKNNMFIGRWEGIFPGLIPKIHNIALYKQIQNGFDIDVSWMVSDPTDFEPATKQNLGGIDRLKILFEVLNDLGINLGLLNPHQVLVRKHLGDSPFTYTPRPLTAPANAVPYHNNVILLSGWHRNSQRMGRAQLLETRETFKSELPDALPPPLKPSTKQPDGFWYCQEYLPETGEVCSARFHYAANLREHLVELHEVSRGKLDNEVEPVQDVNVGKEEAEVGVIRVGMEGSGHGNDGNQGNNGENEGRSGGESVGVGTEEDVWGSDIEEVHTPLTRTGPSRWWVNGEILLGYQSPSNRSVEED